MIQFTTRILKFSRQGEKTGWTYIEISRRYAQQLKPGNRVSFRIQGLLDQHPVQKKALLPMGEGKFILPLNLSMRRAIGKGAGDNLTVQMEEDRRDITPSADFMKCLRDEPRALAHFKSLPGAHQRYFSKWIEEAKTIHTKTKRITMAVIALASNQGFPEMMRSQGNLRG